MTNLVWANDRYRIATDLLGSRIEVMPIADMVGAELDRLLRRFLKDANDDPGVWEDMIGSLKSLRWRLLTNPQPRTANARVMSAVEDVAQQARSLRMAVSATALIDQVLDACGRLLADDSPVGPVLLESVRDVGAPNCVVVTVTSSVESLSGWLHPLGISVMSVNELAHQDHEVEQVYVVGPPRFFPSAVVTAPVSSQIAFVLPHWFRDTALPRSLVGQVPNAEGAFTVQVKLSPVPPDLPSVVPVDAQLTEDDLLPGPNWTALAEPDREPGDEEVMARYTLLSGGLGVFLDNGDRIRSIDPTQPPQERLMSIPVSAVGPGTYLVLRKDDSDLGILYEDALRSLGPQAGAIVTSQRHWKEALRNRLSQQGARAVSEELKRIGVRAHGRVGDWVIPTLDMPQRMVDFQLLLWWLGVSEQPTVALARRLRQKRLQLGQEARVQLESLLANTDLSPLLRTGHLELPASAQFRGMTAARVLAVSPHQEIIPRQRARVVVDDVDGGGRWLE